MDNLLLKYDCVLINDLTLPMSVGIYDHEKSQHQKVIINVKIYVEKLAVTEKQTINDVVSYEGIVNAIKKLCHSKHFDLVEELAEDISKICLNNHLTQATEISVEKPDIIDETRSVGVQILRQRPNSC